jgi:hypothetical protein
VVTITIVLVLSIPVPTISVSVALALISAAPVSIVVAFISRLAIAVPVSVAAFSVGAVTLRGVDGGFVFGGHFHFNVFCWFFGDGDGGFGGVEEVFGWGGIWVGDKGWLGGAGAAGGFVVDLKDAAVG